MWETVLLAGTGGGLTTLVVWRVLFGVATRAEQRQIDQRVKGATVSVGSGEQHLTIPLRDTRSSVVPQLQQFLDRFAVVSAIALILHQAGSRLNVGAFVLLHLLSAALTYAMAIQFHAPQVIAIGLAVMAAFIPLAIMAAKRRRRIDRLTEQLPDAIRLISSSLRAGLGLDVGLNTVVAELLDPIKGEFRQLVNESMLELNMNDAFRRFSKRIPIGDYQLSAASACLHREVGGNFAELLDQLEETVRQRFRLYRELKTMTALSRMEGLILAILPVAVGTAMFFLNPPYFRFFFDDPLGRTLLWAMIALQVVGFLVIRWMSSVRIQ